MRAGDGQTQWQEVQVIDYPDIDQVKLIVSPPKYVNRPDIEKQFIPRRMKVTQGTIFNLAMKPRDPVERLVVSVLKDDNDVNETSGSKEDTAKQFELNADSRGWYRFEQVLREDVLIELKMWSEHGLQNEGRITCRVEAIADAAPVARVISPTEEMAVADDEVIEIEFEAHDDHGIAKAELVVYDDSKLDEEGNPTVLEVREIPLGDQALQKHLTGSVQLDLNDFTLEKDAQISYAIRVYDNRESDASEFSREASNEPASRSANPSEKSNSKSQSNESNADSQEQQSNLEKQMQMAKDDKPSADANSDQRKTQSESTSKKGNQESESGNKDKSDANETSDKTGRDSSKADPETPDSSANRLPGEMPGGAPSKLGKKPGSEPTKDAPAADATEPSDRPTDDNTNKTKDRDAQAQLSSGSQTPRSSSAQSTTAPQKQPKVTSDQLDAMTSAARRPNSSASQQGQNTMTRRRRLKITERLSAIAAADESDRVDNSDIRQRVVDIDRQLSVSQTALKALVDHSLPDSTRGEKFVELDKQIGSIQDIITELRNETKSNEYAFVGLQMVDISRFHITPARDRVFAAIRRPGASDMDAKVALGNINRAREQLAKLLKRYDRVKRDRDLSKSLDEKVKMYEVYIEKSQQLLREARQNKNPMNRKMSIIEVDQDYLDRLAEVLRLRREMMAEFADMLGDDPRLMSRYMDLTRRRRDSMRSRLTDLAARQDEATAELMGWLEIDPQQRDDLWTIIVELRLGASEQLASEVADLAERITRQMPLSADPERGTPRHIIQLAESMAQAAQQIVMDSEKLLEKPDPTEIEKLQIDSDSIAKLSDRLEALLEQLQIEKDGIEEVNDFVEPRILETRIVGSMAEEWAVTVQNLAKRQYGPIASVEQHAIAADTHALRIDMLNIQTELEQQFARQEEAELPSDVIELIQELHRLMESITMNQIAASINASTDRLEKAAQQQQLALERLDRAEELFDRIRRNVVDELDKYDEPNPNIADLRDPTLDEFLARLEREPNIAEELGLPRRRRNLRILANSMLWRQQAQGMLGSSSNAARARAKQLMQENRKPRNDNNKGKKPSEDEESKPLTDEERQRLAKAKEQQKEMEKSLLEIQERAEAENQTPQQRQRLRQIARQLKEMMESDDSDEQGLAAWQRIAQSDQAKAVLDAARRGEVIPDDQWNKISSTLEDGLWQVRGKKPPEEYRKAIQHYQDSLRELVGSLP